MHRRNARKMRRVLTDAELRLWNAIRAHRLEGLAFRRQMPIAGYIVDFACPQKKLIVEVDGSQHGRAEQSEADRHRDERLAELGWTVLRFWNDDVLRNLEDVCLHLLSAADLLAVDAAAQAASNPEGPPLKAGEFCDPTAT